MFACLCVCAYRFKDSDHETSADKTQTKEIYPVDIILENKDGIKGSCAVFKQRTDVTKHVRSKSLTPLLSLQEALERFVKECLRVTVDQPHSDDINSGDWTTTVH